MSALLQAIGVLGMALTLVALVVVFAAVIARTVATVRGEW